jgi:hypothetical protein
MQLDTALVYLLNNSGVTPAKLNQAAKNAALLDTIRNLRKPPKKMS